MLWVYVNIDSAATTACSTPAAPMMNTLGKRRMRSEEDRCFVGPFGIWSLKLIPNRCEQLRSGCAADVLTVQSPPSCFYGTQCSKYVCLEMSFE